MQQIQQQLDAMLTAEVYGSIVDTESMTATVADFHVPLGGVVEIQRDTGDPLPAEVIGFREGRTLLYPLSPMTGVRQGNRVRLSRTSRWLNVGEGLLGRVIDANGQPIDGRPLPASSNRMRMNQTAPSPIDRPPIDAPFTTGVRALDGMLTCGKGQRMGIFAGSGVGKSVLLGMMARNTSADVNVIALVGERGREVNEFIQRDLGPEGLARSVVVVATSDEPALARIRAAMTATAVAEYFRDSGKDVMLLMDSVTRFAMAQREIGLAAGEPPTSRGYPPSVFALLPRLLERAGRTEKGSITAFYSVLVEGDDPNEPISDAVRGLLDGHTWLSRDLAARGHYPAIDILQSISRLMPAVAGPEQNRAAMSIRELLAAYRDHEDLISIGAYRPGGNPTVDVAIAMRDILNLYLRQGVEEATSLEETCQAMIAIHQRIQTVGKASPPPASE